MLLIQQMLMMMWEATLEYWGIVMALLGGLIIAWVLGKVPYYVVATPNHRLTGLFSGLVAVVAFFMLPKFFSASFNDLSYWVDWAFHGVMVIAAFVYSYLVILPLTAKRTLTSSQ